MLVVLALESVLTAATQQWPCLPSPASGTQLAGHSLPEMTPPVPPLQGCNVWVYCANSQGCAGELRKYRQCWLKQASGTPGAKAGEGAGSGWISGYRQAYI